jgi:hypothetical protein
MKNNFILFFCLTILLSIFGCKNDYPTSVYDANHVGKPQPVITSITPLVTASGVGDITINGSNFSSVLAENYVYFDKKIGVVYSASPTQLKEIGRAHV